MNDGKIILPHEDKGAALSFAMPDSDFVLCQLIAERYRQLVEANSSHRVDEFTTCCDIAVTHCNGCRLELLAFYSCDAQLFYDEVSAIVRTLDRKTGKLRGHVPKFARKH